MKLVRLDSVKLTDAEVKGVFRLAKLAFNSKRKTLLNSLQGGLGIEKSKLTEISERYKDVDMSLRPQNLQVEDWKIMYNIFNKEGLI